MKFAPPTSRLGSILRVAIKRFFPVVAVAVALCTSTPHVRADSITSLFSTAVGTNGAVLGDGHIDPHYTLIQSADPGAPGPSAFTVNNNVFPRDGCWAAPCAGSNWIGASASQIPGQLPGQYTYRTTFDLTNFNPATASITGQWAADNTGVAILLNGQNTGNSIPGILAFTSLHDFAITSGFVNGVNTLDFVTSNAPDPANRTPTGLDVCVTGTATLNAVPEPGSLALAGMGIVGAVAFGWRRLFKTFG